MAMLKTRSDSVLNSGDDLGFASALVTEKFGLVSKTTLEIKEAGVYRIIFEGYVISVAKDIILTFNVSPIAEEYTDFLQRKLYTHPTTVSTIVKINAGARLSLKFCSSDNVLVKSDATLQIYKVGV